MTFISLQLPIGTWLRIAATWCLVCATVPLLGVETQRIPIHAWIGILPSESTPARYRELAEAGFTSSMSIFPDLASVQTALDAAKGTGVKLFITCPELTSDTAKTVRAVMRHPSLGGYHLIDEPNQHQFEAAQKLMSAVQVVDPVHPCYINLHGMRGYPDALHYAAYIEIYLRFVRPSFLSFDLYATEYGDLDPMVFTNLEIIAAAAQKSNLPFWTFYQSGYWEHARERIPKEPRSLATLRLDAWCGLAYGSQAIQAFTYWTPTWGDGVNIYLDGPIGPTGAKTRIYDLVKQVNAEITGFSRVFADSQVIEVTHAGGTLPDRCRAYTAHDGLPTIDPGSGSVVVSVLEKSDQIFLVLVNKDIRASVTVRLDFVRDSGVTEIRKDGRDRTAASGDHIIAAGDILILRLSARSR